MNRAPDALVPGRGSAWVRLALTLLAASALPGRGAPATVVDLSARCRADARALSRKPAESWSLQLLVGCQEGTVRTVLAAEGPGLRLFVLPVTVGGRPCHRILTGTFPTSARARAAVPRVPRTLWSPGPPPEAVRVSSILAAPEVATLLGPPGRDGASDLGEEPPEPEPVRLAPTPTPRPPGGPGGSP